MIKIEKSNRLGSLLACAVAAVVLSACGDSGKMSEDPKVITIAEARALSPDSEATVEGTVTVAPGTFVSATSEEGFALQDDSDGVYVTLAKKLDFGLGATVRVTGRAGEMAKLRVLATSEAEVEDLGAEGKTVTPEQVETGSVNETVEGRLVQVSGKVSQAFADDSPYGYKLYVDDGSGEIQIFIHVSAGFKAADLMALAVDDSVTVIGFTSQYEDTYEVAPRTPADLIQPQ
jgi:DNA/RNA endonuclease YhcR with UshA esterase domain